MNKISNLRGKGGHNPLFLEFFNNIMFDKTEPIKENKLKIVNYIFESSNKYEFLFMKENPYCKPSDEDSDSDQEVAHNKFKQFSHHIFNLDVNTKKNY